MSRCAAPGIGNTDRQAYEIRLKGSLGQRWTALLDGMTATANGDGTTTLSGTLADQSALHGVLQRIRDLGMPIISVRQLGEGQDAEKDTTS